MTEPVSPRKQSLMPSSRLRKALRAAGHHLSPVVQVGKEGPTPAVAQALDAQLLAHELIKVKVGSESPEGRFEVAAWLAGLPGAQVAQLLGRTVLLYRKHPQKPRYEPGPKVPAAKLTPAEKRRPVRRPAPRRSSRREERPTEGRTSQRTGRWPDQRTERRPSQRTERSPKVRTERRPERITKGPPEQRPERRPKRRPEQRPERRQEQRPERRTIRRPPRDRG